MKRCSCCKKDKPFSEFNKNKSKKDGLNTVCRPCSNARSKLYYKENTEHHKKVIKRIKAGIVEKIKVKTNEIKAKGCVCCPEREIVCMDFHHVEPHKKEFLISKMIQDACSQKIEKELAKCIVLCSNCHRKFHAGLITLPPINS